MRTGGRANTNLKWLVGDHASIKLSTSLGSTSVTADYTGALISRTLYKPLRQAQDDAWGGRKRRNEARRFRVRYQSGTLPTKYTFTGQYSHTADFGLMYYVARWYDPYLNRFIQPDSIVPEPGNPIAYDRYAYSANNPLRYSDPSGHSWWDAVGQFATGFVTEFARTNAWYAPHAQDALAVSATESDAMLAGRVVADIATIAIGVTEVVGGITIGTAGTAASCGATLCLGAVATVGRGSGDGLWRYDCNGWGGWTGRKCGTNYGDIRGWLRRSEQPDGSLSKTW